MINPSDIKIVARQNPDRSWLHDYYGNILLHHGMTVDLRVDGRFPEVIEKEVRRLIIASIWNRVYGDLIPVIARLEEAIEISIPPARIPAVRELLERLKAMLDIRNQTTLGNPREESASAKLENEAIS